MTEARYGCAELGVSRAKAVGQLALCFTSGLGPKSSEVSPRPGLMLGGAEIPFWHSVFSPSGKHRDLFCSPPHCLSLNPPAPRVKKAITHFVGAFVCTWVMSQSLCRGVSVWVALANLCFDPHKVIVSPVT